MNHIIQLENALEVMEWWPLFRQGLEELNDPRRANLGNTPEEFLRIALHCACKPEPEALCIVAASKNKKPLGFGMGFVVKPFWATRKLAWIYAVYSTGKNASIIDDMMNYCQHWAKDNGVEDMQACTGRLTGAALRWFKKQGFRPKYYYFEKAIL